MRNIIELRILKTYRIWHRFYPIAAPTLVETMKLRMYEMDLSQTKLAEMLGLSTARISEIITGKGEPSLKTIERICISFYINKLRVKR
jgi:HTH-type transcriptional regulator/antitoxin HigA